MQDRKHVVILGAGYAGLSAAHTLQSISDPKRVGITIVDKNNYHTNMVALHEVAAGNAQAQDITFDVVPVLDRPHVDFLHADVLSVDRKNKQVETSAGTLCYDVLVVALGFEPETFGIDGLLDNAFQVYTLGCAQAIAAHVERRFRTYAFAPKAKKDPADITIAIGGAGFTGIELLGEFCHRIPKLCKKYHISPRRVKLYCIHRSGHMLDLFNEEEVAYVKNYLEKHGVTFLLHTPIVGSTHDSFIIERAGEQQTLRASTLIWTAGVRGSHLMETIFEKDRIKRGRLAVGQDLRDPQDPFIYVLGDCASFTPLGAQEPYPTTAQIAAQMGVHAGKSIQRQLLGKTPKPFVYNYHGTICSLGPTQGVAHLGKRTLRGFFAQRLKRVVETKSDAQISGVKNALKKTRVLRFREH